MKDMQREIEIKVRVESFGPLLAKLGELGVAVSEPVFQDDSTLINYDGDFRAFPEGANFLRVRRTGVEGTGKSYFTLKRGSEMASIERETEISDPQQMEEALVFMGYHEVTRVKKMRQKAKYNEYEICFDKVEELGEFIEIEKMSDQDPVKVADEMIQLLADFGIAIKERVVNGYDTLMYMHMTGGKRQ